MLLQFDRINERGEDRTYKRLLESVHPMTTQKNEAMNNCIARLLPKTKHFSKTPIILTRVEVAVCYCNLGLGNFYTTICDKLMVVKNLGLVGRHSLLDR